MVVHVQSTQSCCALHSAIVMHKAFLHDCSTYNDEHVTGYNKNNETHAFNQKQWEKSQYGKFV